MDMEKYLNLNIDELLEHYSNGVTEIAFLIAKSYEEGSRGASVDYASAAKLYRQIIDNGYMGVENAKLSLANLYLRGRGVNRDGELAERMMLELGENGFVPSFGMIGFAYKNGWFNGRADYKKAEYWLRKGGDTGSTGCKVALAEMYFCSQIDGKQDVPEGARILNRVLEAEPYNPLAGWYVANFQLKGGVADENGEVIIQENIPAALETLERLAENGDNQAVGKLIDVYGDLESDLFDYTKFVKYSEIASANGEYLRTAGLAFYNLSEEFCGYPGYSPKRGIEAGKTYLLNGETQDRLKEMILGNMVKFLWEKCENDRSYRLEEAKYLISNFGYFNLEYIDDDNAANTANAVLALYSIIKIDDRASFCDRISGVISTLERISANNEYLQMVFQWTFSDAYTDLAGNYLSAKNYETAKYYYEKAAGYGSEEAVNQLAHFKTNFFGKLIYK